MSVAWPGAITQKAHAGSYQEKPLRNVASFAPEVGPAKVRRRTLMRMRDVRFDVVMTMAAYEATFLPWWRSDLADGVKLFTRKSPKDLTGADVTMQFKDAAEPPGFRQHGLTSCIVSLDVWQYD